MTTALMHQDHELLNPFGESVTVRLYDDGRIAIEGVVEWEGVKQKAWIPAGPHFVPHTRAPADPHQRAGHRFE